MNIFTFAFQEILLKPILNLFMYIYSLPYVDFGMAVLILTFLIRILLWPLNTKAIVSQKEVQEKTQELQIKIKEIQDNYRNDVTKQNEEILKIWKEKKVNPFSSFTPLIIQLIILIAFYQVLRISLEPSGLELFYSFVPKPNEISPTFLGFLDLSRANSFLAVITGASQYFYSKLSFDIQKKGKKEKNKEDKERAKNNKTEERMQKMIKNQMLYFMPLFTIFICFTLPSYLSLYWLTSTLIGVLQYKLIYRKLN